MNLKERVEIFIVDGGDPDLDEERPGSQDFIELADQWRRQAILQKLNFVEKFPQQDRQRFNERVFPVARSSRQEGEPSRDGRAGHL